MDRKELVKVLSEFLGVKSKYLGAPSFAYEIKTESESYIIDRLGAITNSHGSTVELNEILNLATHEESEEKSIDSFQIEFPFGDHTGKTLLNIVNMLYSKQNLIVQAFNEAEVFMDKTFAEDLNNKPVNSIEDFKKAIAEIGPDRCKGLSFNFEKGTLVFKLVQKNPSPETIDAFMKLAGQINEYAKKLKHTSYKLAQEDNPKYALRTWLIRLGMGGNEYKSVRKTLLSNLEGSGAFRKYCKKGVD